MLSACTSKTNDQIVVELNEDNFWDYFYVVKETKEFRDGFGNLIHTSEDLVFKSKMFEQDYIVINDEDFAIAISFMDTKNAMERLASTDKIDHFLSDSFLELCDIKEVDSFKNDILKLQVKGTITFDKKENHKFEIREGCRYLDGEGLCGDVGLEY